MEVYKRIESSCLSTLRYILVACMGITLHVMADTSVGTPAGSLSVNESGAAVYTIPFDISPSGTGLDPKIGLSYNSQQAGYGNVGYGISITGLSCITRTGKDIYHDGMMQKVRYKQGDNYLLDGKRLYLKSGTAGSDGAAYTVEGNPYLTVTLHGTDLKTNYSTWFEMRDSEGNVYMFAYVQRCYLGSPNKESCTIAWYLTSVTNINGDYLSYHYSQDNYCMYPDSITYGRYGARNSVALNYEPLSVPQKFVFEGGTEGQIGKRLSSVTTKHRGNIYRTYTLIYDTSSDASSRKYDRLVSVNVQNGDGESLKPITLNWDYLKTTNVNKRTCSVSTEATHGVKKDEGTSSFFSSDLNGDGISDIVRLWNGKVYESYYGSKSYSAEYRAFAYISTSYIDSNGNVTYGSPYCCIVPASIDFSEIAGKDVKTISGGSNVCNLDGDGVNDILLPYYDVSESDKLCKFAIIRYSNIIPWSNYTTIDVPLKSTDEVPLYGTMDFNGDGKDEIIYIEQKKKDGIFYGDVISVDFEHHTESHNKLQITYTSNKDIKKMFLVDCNADGFQDILLLFDDGYKIYYNNADNSLSSIFSETNSKEVTSSSTMKNYWRMEPGDFDGDGLVDFVCIPQSEWYMKCFRNNGNGTFTLAGTTEVDFIDKNTDKDDNRFAVRIADFDKDGRSDVFIAKADLEYHGGLFSNYYSYRTTQLRWYLSDGTKPVLWKATDKPHDADDSREGYIFTGDFDGDGYAEIANYGANLINAADNTFKENTINVYSFPTSVSLGRIGTIVNGFGKRTTITYLNGTDPRVYSKGNTNEDAYPVNTYTIPLPLVSQVTQTDGAAGSACSSYSYSGLKAHLEGRGLIGFSSKTLKTTRGSVTKTCTSDVTWDKTYWIPQKVKSTVSVGGKTATTIVNNSIFADDSWNKNFFSYNSETTETDFDGYATDVSRTFNPETGDLLSEQTCYDGDEGMYVEKTYGDYCEYSGKRLPTIITTRKKHYDDSNVYSMENEYTYNTKGYITTEKQTSTYNASSIELTTSYTRDYYGNVLSETTTGEGVIPITRNYTYDTKGLLLTKKYTSPASTSTTYSYDVWGNVISESDTSDPSNILTTTYGYDGWGNCILTKTPDGVNTQTQTVWNQNYANSVFCTTTSTDGSAPVTVAYDSEGRKVATATKGKHGVDVTTSIYYNCNGKPSNESVKIGNRWQYETTSYDDFDRVTSHRNTDGTTSTYSYTGRSVTSNTPTGTSVKTYDAWGNIINARDAGGDVTYTYSSIGKPLSVETNGSTVSMSYDGAGRRIRLVDPDAGTQTCSYAADGMMLSQTDGNGITTEYAYDALGRMTERRCGDDIVQTTEYGQSGYGLNRIVKEVCNDNVESYQYDRLGRIVTDTRTCNGDTYTKSYQYDAYGRISSANYPGNVAVGYAYDQYGYLQSMYANGNCCFSQQSYSGTEDATSTGNLTCTETISSNGFVTSQKIKRGNELLDGMDYTYVSTTGNLQSRSRYDCLDESFTYDDADRLIGVESEGIVLNDSLWIDGSVAYDDKGNITYKTGVGDYDYTTSKPHAVTGIHNIEDGISTLGLSTYFNDDGKISSISQTIPPFVRCLNYDYGPNREKWETTYMNRRRLSHGGFSQSHFYFGDYERISSKNSVIEQYFPGNGVIIIRQDGELRICKAFCDIQGSILSVFDKDSGEQVFKASYDAWGQQAIEVNDIELTHGYCGHDMLSQFNLIDMGGRVYDPDLGRFLSCDNYVQEPANSQNFNRYSYCLNNPLRYTDLSGELFGIDDAILITAAVIVGSGVLNTALNADNIHNFGQAFCYFSLGSGSALAAIYGGPIGVFGAGALIGGGNSIVTQGFANGFGNIDWDNVAGSAIFGGITSSFSSAIGSYVTSVTGNWLSSISNVTLRETLNGTVGGIITGAAMGGISDLNGADGSFLENLGRGAALGALVGSFGGYAKGRIEQADINRTAKFSNKYVEKGKLPDDATWESMSPYARGEYGTQQVLEELKSQFPNAEFVREVSYNVNGTTYRADISYFDNNGRLHIVEVKSGVNPGFTTNQKITIPALQGGGNVKVVPFGANATRLFNKLGVPNQINSYTFDLYRLK